MNNYELEARIALRLDTKTKNKTISKLASEMEREALK